MAKKEKVKPEKTKPVKEKKGKEKKGKKKDQAAAASQPLSPDGMTNAQLEQAIRDSNDPTSALKKLKSPISVGKFFIYLFAFIILTCLIVTIWCAIAVDKFNFVTIVKDMSNQYGITQFFTNIWTTMQGWFS